MIFNGSTHRKFAQYHNHLLVGSRKLQPIRERKALMNGFQLAFDIELFFGRRTPTFLYLIVISEFETKIIFFCFKEN